MSGEIAFGHLTEDEEIQIALEQSLNSFDASNEDFIFKIPETSPEEKDLSLLVVEDDDYLSNNAFVSWHPASKYDILIAGQDILSQMPSDANLTLDEGFLMISAIESERNALPEHFQFSFVKELPLNERRSNLRVIVKKKPMVVKHNVVYSADWKDWHVANGGEAEAFLEDILDALQPECTAELVDGIVYGQDSSFGDLAGTVSYFSNEASEASKKPEFIVIMKNRTTCSATGSFSSELSGRTVHITNRVPEYVQMTCPQPFLVTNSEGLFEMDPKLASFLRNVEKPMTVVAVAGIFRTGKSYLLNRLMRKQAGFPLGGTVESKTKGIWLWLSNHPIYPDKTLVLLDTEGLADPDKGDQRHDISIFSLAILLSNVFIFNSRVTIDNRSLQDLHLVTKLSSHLQVKSGTMVSEEETFQEHFPEFIWAIRDAFLACVVDGKPATPNNYLEHHLQLRRGHSNEVKEANEVRASIKEHFQKRSCFLFPFPVGDQSKLLKLEDVPYEELDKKFVQVSDEFVEYVLKIEDVKCVQDKPLNGSMFVSLATSYLQTINQGGVPCIENAVNSMAAIENAKFKNEAIDVYDKHWSHIHLPIDGESFESIHKRAVETSTDFFLSKVVFDKEQKEAVSFAACLDERRTGLVIKNYEASVNKSKNALERLYQPIKEKIQNGDFTLPGGYSLYVEAMKRLELDYCKLANLGTEKENALRDFKRSKEIEGIQILGMDRQLTNKERELEEVRLQKLRQEEEMQAKKEEFRQLEREQEQREEEFRRGMIKMREELQNKAAKEAKETRKKISNYEAEIQKIREEMPKKADEYKKKIAALNEELKKKDNENQSTMRKFQENLEAKMREQEEKFQREISRLQNIPPKVVHVRKRGCFPGKCTVETLNGLLIYMNRLRKGDKVLVGFSPLGEKLYEEILGFLDKETQTTIEYLEITTKRGMNVALTSSHLIYKNQKSIEPIFAGDLCIGDFLLSATDKEFVQDEIVSIRETYNHGLYCPLTRSGNIVVDGILASCYASFPHTFAHDCLWLIRLFPWILDSKNSQNRDGCRFVVKILKKYGELRGKRRAIVF